MLNDLELGIAPQGEGTCFHVVEADKAKRYGTVARSGLLRALQNGWSVSDRRCLHPHIGRTDENEVVLVERPK